MAILAKLMGMEQRKTYEKFKENLTMEENPIKITIENYKNQTIQFTMPPDTPVSVLRGTTSDRFNYLNISVVGGDKYTTHETKHFIYFYLGQIAVLLFKSG